MWPLFSSRTPYALTSVLERDHLIEGNAYVPLEERVRDIVQEHMGIRPRGDIYLLTGLRVMGIEFNPVSFYYVYEQHSRELQFVVAEVNNIPWFEQHAYVLTPTMHLSDSSVLRATDDDSECSGDDDFRDAPRLRAFSSHKKAFHVSPFIDMDDVRYTWLISRPCSNLQFKIGLVRNDKQFFLATLKASRTAFSAFNLLSYQVTHPLHTAKVMLAILYEAAKLFRRGFTFVPHPHGTETFASVAVAKVVTTFRRLQTSFSRLFTAPIKAH